MKERLHKIVRNVYYNELKGIVLLNKDRVLQDYFFLLFFLLQKITFLIRKLSFLVLRSSRRKIYIINERYAVPYYRPFFYLLLSVLIVL